MTRQDDTRGEDAPDIEQVTRPLVSGQLKDCGHCGKQFPGYRLQLRPDYLGKSTALVCDPCAAFVRRCFYYTHPRPIALTNVQTVLDLTVPEFIPTRARRVANG